MARTKKEEVEQANALGRETDMSHLSAKARGGLSEEDKKVAEAPLAEQSSIKTEVDPAETADPGEINEGVSADQIPPSGAISEPKAVADIPVDHPAVDDNPRKGLPAESNRIDFNDPTY